MRDVCRVCLLIFRAGGRIAHRGGGRRRGRRSGWRDAAAAAAADEIRHVAQPVAGFFLFVFSA